MNETQTVFALFFAIFWGAVANVQPRWKAYHWPYIRVREARNRLSLSILVLNILPISFFAFSLFALAGPRVAQWTPTSTVLVVIFGVFPAFAIFGFNRLWLGIVESNVEAFYRKGKDGKYVTEDDYDSPIDPQPTPKASKGNIISGVGYLAFALLLVVIRWLVIN